MAATSSSREDNFAALFGRERGRKDGDIYWKMLCEAYGMEMPRRREGESDRDLLLRFLDEEGPLAPLSEPYPLDDSGW